MESLSQNNDNDNMMSVFLELLKADATINVNKALNHAIGLDEAVLYCEIISRYIYFADKGQLDDEGYFFNMIDDLEAATSLKVKRQRRAISNLQNLGLIDYKVKGMPARRYFKVIFNAKLISHYLQKGKQLMNQLKEQKSPVNEDSSQLGQNGLTRKAETAKLDRPDRPGNKTKVNKTKINKNKKDLKEGGPKQTQAPAPEKPSSILEEEKPRAEAKDPGSEVGQALGFYRDQFELRTNRQPDIKDKDVAALKRVVKKYGLEETKAMLQIFFKDQDPFYKKAGYPLLTFCSQINRFITKLQSGGKDEQPKAWDNLKEFMSKGDQDQGPVYEAAASREVDRGPAAAEEAREPEPEPVSQEAFKAGLQEVKKQLAGAAS